ncbi:MAG: ankyrin repeat domain-containing protein [Candidatus Electrothrix sp. AW5]|nr:ankyrin repeat domain-containing protein [Candidatus Electrothrix gigas]
MKTKTIYLFAITITFLLSISPFTAYATEDINSQLLEMVKSGDVEAVKSLLEKGADVDARDSSQLDRGRTALMLAVRNRHKKIVKILIDNGADINLKNDKFSLGENALIIAIRNESVDIVKMLLNNGAHTNAIVRSYTISNGVRIIETTTALIEATDIGNEEILDLLQHGKTDLTVVKAGTIDGADIEGLLQNSETDDLTMCSEYDLGVVQAGNSKLAILDLQDGNLDLTMATSGYTEVKAGTDNIPSFPWPPPKSSAFAKIPSEFLNAKKTLKDVANKLETAFDQNGYFQKKYYRVPDGFALVSQLEQFRPDGSSKKEPDRWAAEFRPPRIFSLTSYINAIFKAHPGRYRIVAFIVTSQPFEESEKTVTREEAMAWLDKGMVVLPKSIGEQPYTDEHYCTALIYEFELPENGKKALFKTSSNLTGRDHLQKSNLWTALQQ